MSDKKITLRRIEKIDYPFLRHMLGEAFDLYTYSDSPYVMNHLLAHYLYSYLSQSSYGTVAEYEHEPVGILLGRCDSDFGLKKRHVHFFGKLYHGAFLVMSRAGRRYFRSKKIIAQTDKALRANSLCDGDSELVLFIVCDHMREHGIGHMLLRPFKDYLTEHGSKKMYVFTDDFCDVEFYNIMGYEKVAEKQVALEHFDKTSGFYLYSIDTDKITN